MACAAAVVQLFHQAMSEKHPADRALSSFLRQNHQYGARDRRIISETLFSVLRWWGWLRYIAPEDPSVEKWLACLAAAWILEGRSELPPSASWWLHKSGIRAQDIPQPPPNFDIAARRKCLRPFFPGELPALTLEKLLPEWALPLIKCPEDALELVSWLQRRPPMWLRAQSNDLDRIIGEFSHENVKLARHELMDHALRANFVGINLRQTESYRAGKIEVQDIASQAVALIAAPKPGEHWWDCCAGAGGKTLHMAWLMHGKGQVLASDKRLFKLEELRQRAKRCNLGNIICKEWLGIEVKSLAGRFNGVLVDAPCSCSGTWRRNPDLRWTTDKDSINETAELQLRLLTNASKAVAPGGTLVYATCSMFEMENKGVVDAFLLQDSDFQLEPFASPITGGHTDGMLQTWPWQADCDSMFIAKMRRK